jgi:hypothetical protein
VPAWWRCIAATDFDRANRRANEENTLLRLLIALTLSLFLAQAYAAAGDAYVYRVFNGYNNEVRGTVSYRIENAQADRIQAAVATDTPSAGSARTEVYTKNGNWLRHALASHDQVRNFEFSQPLPVYVPPGNTDGSWSARIDALDAVTGKRNSVRVDGKVLGNERITVAAGTFDTVKIKRYTYVGDWDSFLRETHIEDTDWYAPALGRPVRSESKSSWQDTSRCSRGGCPWFRGDWNVSELVEVSATK